MTSNIRAAIRTVLSLSLLATTAAQAAEAPASEDLDPVIVTGTRTTGLKAGDSPAPIQVIDSSALLRTGAPDIAQALTQNVPAFTVQSYGGDTQELTLAAALRGLSPNDTLVLINGKRRHTTANLSVDTGAGPYQGGAAADWSFIPTAAVDHVEVLTDGAAAQYGTDAIAGVVNVILKSDHEGGIVNLSDGRYFRGDGETPDISANAGFAPTANSFINVTAESKFHDYTDRGAIDPRALDPATIQANPTITQYPGYPYVNRVDGDGLYHLNILSLNAGADFGGSELYAFGTYGRRLAKAFENYRLPSVLPAVWPNGFEPQEDIDETDAAFTLGLKGALESWKWDLSSTYGRDRISVSTINSGNVSLFTNTGSTPTSAHDGNWVASQWTTNLDLSRELSVGFAKPMNLAIGAEYRHETFEIDAGDYAATYLEGMQSYPGFTRTDAGTHGRNNVAGYVDVAVSPVDRLSLDAAGRTEHYSDFGQATVGKLTGRFDFTPSFALRGTVSTGFRAATLAEEYYSATNVNINSAFVQLPPNSAGARIIGIDGLKPEKSHNYSFGLVAHPLDKLTFTLDAYQISIADRIAATGGLFASGYGGQSAAIAEAIVANGNVLAPGVQNFGIQTFANGIDTRTRGAEFVLTYPTILDDGGRIDWTASGSYNKTVLTDIHPNPAPIVGQALFGPGAISDLTTTTPLYRVILAAHYSLDRFSATVRESLYGPSHEQEQGDDGNFYTSSLGVAATTDLSIDYKVTSRATATIGATNAFDRRPSSFNPALLANYRANLDPQSVLYPASFSPYGINGGYYYAKLAITF